MKKITLTLFVVLAIFTNTIFAQAIVSLNPPFPTGTDQVIITYNADQGNGALANLPMGTGVFAHLGITVDGQNWQFVVGNWGTADSRVAMTRVGTTNQYTLSLTPSIKNWFQTNNNAAATIPAAAEITKLCIVFRNLDGSLEGKTSTNGDIFVDLATSSFSAAITSHQQSSLLVDANQNITFVGQTSAAAELQFSLDGSAVASGSNSTLLNYNLNTNDLGDGLHTLIFAANNGTTTIRDTVLVTRHITSSIAVLPNYGSEGIIYPNETTAYLQIRAPFKSFIYVLGDFNNWTFDPNYRMKKTPDSQYFWIEIPNLIPTQEYRFQYYIDWEGIRVADAYCEKILDPWNDQWIDESVYPNLLPYPQGLAEGIVGVLQTRPEAYQWDNSYTYTRPPQQDLVIYELLVRDFTESRTFTEIIDKLPYIETLGVNALELMPVAEFDGNDSWGYSPNFCSAVDKYYGTKNELKRLIDSCHAHNIAVISDVVFNHAWGQSPFVKMYFDPSLGDYGEPTAQNPWCNQTARHPFNVGYDLNHESLATKYFVKKTLKHWMDEFKIDGFRFDLSKGFTQTNSGDNIGLWGNYDQSRVNILEDYAASIRQTDANAFIIFEHFGAWDEEAVYANNGIMLWGYSGSTYSEAAMGWPSNQNLYTTTPQARGWGNYGLQGFLESHDEERLMYKNLNFGNSSGSYNTRSLNTALDRMGAAAAFFFPLPGPKMVYQFGEVGYDYSINTCYDGTINSDCRTGSKPIHWEYYTNADRKKLFEVYRKLIYLKKTQPVFRDLGHFMDLGGVKKTLRFTSNNFNSVIVGNFDVIGQTMNPEFPFGGVWYDYLSGDSLDVSNPGNAFNYAPGEYHVYTDRKIIPPVNTYLSTPDGLEDVQFNADGIIAYPNPFQQSISFKLPINADSKTQITLTDISGRTVEKLSNFNSSSGDHITIDVSTIKSGMYFYSVILNGKSYSGKLIKP
jgi:glycosidase